MRVNRQNPLEEESIEPDIVRTNTVVLSSKPCVFRKTIDLELLDAEDRIEHLSDFSILRLCRILNLHQDDLFWPTNNSLILTFRSISVVATPKNSANNDSIPTYIPLDTVKHLL